MPEGNHVSCIHHLRLDICFDEYSYHDSPRRHLIKGTDPIRILGIGLHGNSLKLRQMLGVFSNVNGINLFLIIPPPPPLPGGHERPLQASPSPILGMRRSSFGLDEAGQCQRLNYTNSWSLCGP